MGAEPAGLTLVFESFAYKHGVPMDADFLPGDRFTAHGETYELVGEIQRMHHPMTGWEPGAVVTGRRPDG